MRRNKSERRKNRVSSNQKRNRLSMQIHEDSPRYILPHEELKFFKKSNAFKK